MKAVATRAIVSGALSNRLSRALGGIGDNRMDTDCKRAAQRQAPGGGAPEVAQKGFREVPQQIGVAIFHQGDRDPGHGGEGCLSSVTTKEA